ncbi:MAG TPA: histidine phosphatase family protein [Stellaceae bacterium]|nr:histidine phosphatase family protein [Stellaceae bacterium]
MNSLYLLRHAKAGPQDSKNDRERALIEPGRQGAKAIAAAISERRIAPVLVLCSAAARARETLAIVLPSLQPAPQIHYEDGLYLADAKQLLARLRKVSEETESVMIVGHNPGLQELAVTLSDVRTGPLMARLAQEFPTSALARFEVALSWPTLEAGGARLTALIAPK